MPVKAYQENLVHVDGRGRIVLPKTARRSDLYAMEVNANDEIILRPRVAVDPREVVNKKTLLNIDESMRYLAKGQAGEPIDLNVFSNGKQADEQEGKVRQAKARRR